MIFDQQRRGTFSVRFLSKLAETKIALELSIIVMRHTINKDEDFGELSRKNVDFSGIGQTSKSDFSHLEQYQTIPGVSCSAASNAVKR